MRRLIALWALVALTACGGGNGVGFAPIRLPAPQNCVTLNSPLQNGDFGTGDFSCWGQAVVATGSVPGHPIFTIFTTANPQGACLPSQGPNNPWGTVDAPGGADGFLYQFFWVPVSATTLQLRTWVTIDPTTVKISLIDANTNTETVLDTFIPPSVNSGSLGNCSGNSPVTKSYNIVSFDGKLVTLRLRATSQGTNNAIANFDDVKTL